MTDQFRKGVRFGWLERLGLYDQVVVAGCTRSRDKVDADRCCRRRIIGGSKLVNDRLHAIRRVLRYLSRFRYLSGDNVTDRYGHILFLISK